MTVEEIMRTMRRRLEPRYGAGETQAIIRIIFSWLAGWNTVQLLSNATREVSESMRARIADTLRRLEEGEPVQYITGLAPFYGLDLHVDRRVLIPRPETEMLVDMIVDENREAKDLCVLDVGTGSGAIAIALARHLLFPQVTAVDVSRDALAVARENAAAFGAKIRFIEADIFQWQPDAKSFDIIVSNPPYIAPFEKEKMESNVLDYEPHTALFAPEENPTAYYRRIVALAVDALRPGGRIYFEINPLYSSEIAVLLKEEYWEDVRLLKDIHGRERYAAAKRR